MMKERRPPQDPIRSWDGDCRKTPQGFFDSLRTPCQVHGVRSLMVAYAAAFSPYAGKPRPRRELPLWGSWPRSGLRGRADAAQPTNAVCGTPTQQRGRLPLTRELAAKRSEGETGRRLCFQATSAYLSLRLGYRRSTSLVRGRHFVKKSTPIARRALRFL